MTANNSTIVADGTIIVVERGPTWLAKLLYDPPAVLVATTGLAALALLAAVIYALAVVDVSRELWLDLGGTLGTAGTCAVITAVLVRLVDWPLAAVVLVGSISGWAAVTGSVRALSEPNS